MKRIAKLFPTFILLLLTVLMIVYIDVDEKAKYTNFKEYHLTGFRINPNNEKLTSHVIDKVLQLAKEKEVLLVKNLFNKEKNCSELYISTDNLLGLYDEQWKVEKINEEVEHSFIATFKTEDQRQSHYIPDFLDNDRFTFYSIDEMEENNIYRYGDYSLYYTNDAQLESFLQEASAIMQEPQEMLANHHWGQLSGHADRLFIVLIVSILFFIFFYYLIIVFQLYKEGKKIGCLLLLGFRKRDITALMIKDSIQYLVISSLCYLLLCLFFVSNIHFSFILKLCFLYLCMIMLTIFISYLGILIVCNYIKVSNVLKKAPLANKISKVLLFSKSVMTGIIIFFLLSFLPILKDSYAITQHLKDNEILMDYAVFPRFNVENAEHDNSANYLTFFQSLDDFDIDHIYADFRDYLITDAISLENFESQEEAGETYRMASIDQYYLEKHDVEVFDLENIKVDYTTFDQEFFILPYSKKSYYDAFYKYIKRRYERYGFDTEIKIYFYKDQTFSTYDATTGIKSITSPIVRVIHKNYPFTYFENYTGLDIAGTGMNTALKIDVSTGKKQVFSKLEACIQKANLQDVLVESNFISYDDFYKDETTKLRNNNILFITAIAILLCIYITLVAQTFILYIQAKMNQVFVKVLLGYEKRHIFKKMISLHIGLSLMVIIGLFIYDLLSGNPNLFTHFIIYLSFICLDILLIIGIIQLIKLDKVYAKLKGE